MNSAENMQESPSTSKIWSILCVDDEQNVLSSLKRLLRTPGCRVFTADNARTGLQLMQQHSIDMVISDMRMPEVSGAEFLTDIATSYPHTARVLLTGYADTEATIAAVNEGKIHRYIQKPWDNHELSMIVDQEFSRMSLEQERQQLSDQVQAQNLELNNLNQSLEKKVQLRTQQIRQAMLKLENANSRVKENHRATLKVFYNLISLNPQLGGKPAIQISNLCQLIATLMQLEPHAVRAIHLAGLLNELGLLGYPAEITSIPYNQLAPEQQDLYRQHPEKAHLALAPSNSLEDVALIIRHQHEHFDGSGYPDRLTADEIPVGSRILAIARDYIYATQGKLQHTRSSSHTALDQLTINAGQIYDGAIVRLLPELLPQLDHEAPSKDERLISAAQLKPGMELSRNIFNSKDILLLPEGHIVTHATIQRLKTFARTEQQLLEIYIFQNH